MTEVPINPDQILSLGQAARLIPTASGKPPSTMTLYRWTRGVRGVVLPSLRFGRRICVRYSDLIQFGERLAATYEAPASTPKAQITKPAPCTPKTRTAVQRERAILAAEARLKARGCMSENRDE